MGSKFKELTRFQPFKQFEPRTGFQPIKLFKTFKPSNEFMG
jgi:hypothetical protein